MKILEQTFDDFKSLIKEYYKKDRFLAASAYREIFKNGNLNFRSVKDMNRNPDFMKSLTADLRLNIGDIEQKNSEDVLKFVTKLSDGLKIESVIIPMFTHNTLCISSQVGCRMGCKFCETGKDGLKRNLSVEEITAQIYNARITLGYDIRNIVYMGMGEPLDNFKNVIKSLEIISDPRGFDIPLTKVTLSTSGRVDGINKLSEQKWAEKINLAVSLNASNDSIRSKLMPVNDKYSMGKLIEELNKFPLRTKGSIFVEYVLIKDVNDSIDDARRLVEYLKPIKNQINLIPYNPGKDSLYRTPDERTVEQFRKVLIDSEVFVRRRATRGRMAMAACGQLS
ncbi:MAG: 23S rRNA (adenine(2503)-C(2))-methyltransferase RlmN [Desulfobacterales bacterium]|nr:23S rRNA (adenine(2503)-C(2))-methyltransferase RlmN [Desulfobacterales bacterium]